MKNLRLSQILLSALLLPFAMGAKGDGCASNSKSPAPDVSGLWNISYDDTISVKLRIGGKAYDGSIDSTGGTLEVMHEGKPLSFDLDCQRPEVICPSEAWPDTIAIEQRNANFEHRMIASLPEQECTSALIAPEASECGDGTLNPDCEDVCEGQIRVASRDRFGVIGESGDTFRLFLGAGLATNGVNCALLGVSLADANLDNVGTRGQDDWRSESMSAGMVKVGYAGTCLWAGDPDMDQELEALVLGASIEFTTGFTGSRAN